MPGSEHTISVFGRPDTMTIDRHDHDAAPALQDEFWGEQTDWTSFERRPSGPRAGVGATIGRWWGGLLGAGSGVDRVHGRVTGDARSVGGRQLDDYDEFDDDEHDDWTAPIAADGDPADEHDDAWTFEPEPPKRRPGVDPLLARFGGLAVVLTLAAPVVMGFTSGSDDDPSAVVSAAGVAAIADLAPAVPTTPVGPVESDTQADTGPAVIATAPPAAAPATDAGDDAASTPVVAATLEEDAPVTAPPVTEPPCGNDYELAAGDYWIRIADAADVDLADLLAVNDASVDTVLVPGGSICLPVGAATPAPPTTSAPRAAATTVTPAATAASPTRSSATTPTVTTAPPAPTTTVPARPAAASAAEAVAIIRAVWPDDLEERAIEIAWRESNHRSNVNNSCCYGLFQIHWEAHRSWLSSLGVTSAWQLYDARTNTVAAYTLYQRAGGFGPWGG
jgi:hypothetical protein